MSHRLTPLNRTSETSYLNNGQTETGAQRRRLKKWVTCVLEPNKSKQSPPHLTRTMNQDG